MYDFVKEREQAMFRESENTTRTAAAKKLLSMGMDIARISEAAGLSEKEIKKPNEH